MSLHKEIEFENGICAYLAAHDWLRRAASDARKPVARFSASETWVADRLAEGTVIM